MSLSEQTQQWYPTSVQVTVLQARSLRIKGKNGTNDAYAIMQVAKDKFSTAVAEKCVAPVWKEEATFDLPLLQPGNAERCTLQVCVMHRALMGPDKMLGQAIINLLELHDNKSRNKTEWFKLVGKTGKADKDRGEVLLDIQFMKNNMTASMFDLSGQDKSRSRFGKLKDKMKGKKKDSISDSSSAIVPSVSQILTDSEGEEDTDATPGSKKKNKLKSLFVPKSGLHRNMSQSMSTLGTLPEKDSAISLSRSSGLNVESPEGKKKFKFLKHKRTGSSDSKVSLGASSLGQGTGQSNVCINGSHVYTEEPDSKGSRAGSTFSLNSSGHGSMEDLRRKTSTSSTDFHKTSDLQAQENAAEEMRRRQEEQRKQEEEVRKRQEEEKRRQAEEEERERIKREEKRKEEERKRVEEERKRIEKVEEMRRLEKQEEERRRIKMEEEKRRLEKQKEERKKIQMEMEEKRRIEEEERERKRIEEEEMVRRKREQERVRQEEERKKAEEERIRVEARKREEEEKIREERRIKELERKRMEEDEQAKREEEKQRKMEEEERVRLEKERLRKEEETRRIEMERKHAEEEERLRKEKEKMEAEKKRKEEEERRMIEEKERKEQETLRLEKEKLELEKKKMEEKEKMRKEQERQRAEEEEQRRIKEEAEQERIRQEEEEMEKPVKKKERSNTLERRPAVRARSARMNTVKKTEKPEDSGSEFLASSNPFEEELLFEENSTNFFEQPTVPQPEAVSRSSKVSAVKPSSSVSGIFFSQATVPNTNPFVDESDAISSNTENTVAQGEGVEILEKKRRAPLPPQNKKQMVKSDVPTRTLPSPSVLGATQSFPSRESEDSGDSDVSSLRQDKRPVPLPPDVYKEHADLSTTPPFAGEWRTHGTQKSDEFSISQNEQHFSHSQPQAETNPFISVGVKKAKHNKGPAPAKPSSKCTSRQNSASEPESNSLSSVDLIEHLTEHSNEASENIKNVSFEGDEMSGSSKKKTRAPLPPSKTAVIGDHNSTSQQPENASISIIQPTRYDQGTTLNVKRKVLTPSLNLSLTNSSLTSSLKTENATLRVEAGLGSGHKSLPHARVPPIDAQAGPEQSNGGETKRTGAFTVCRPHAVKPLSATERQLDLIEMQDNSRSAKITDDMQTKVKAPEVKATGPYSQLTREELIGLVEKQKEQLSQKDSKILELEQYIDNLLVRVMEEKPSILMALNSMKKAV